MFDTIINMIKAVFNNEGLKQEKTEKKIKSTPKKAPTKAKTKAKGPIKKAKKK